MPDTAYRPQASEPLITFLTVRITTVAYNYKDPTVQGRTGRSKTGVEQPWGHTNNWHSID